MNIKPIKNEQNYKIEAPDPIEAIKFRILQEGTKRFSFDSGKQN
nr:hypothetical protein [Sulfurimonas sp. SAG-AH-194-C21]